MCNKECHGMFVFLLGAAAGAAAAVFLQSERGKELLSEAKDWGNEKLDMGLERLEELKDEVEKEIKKKKKLLDKKVQKIKEDLIEE